MGKPTVYDDSSRGLIKRVVRRHMLNQCDFHGSIKPSLATKIRFGRNKANDLRIIIKDKAGGTIKGTISPNRSKDLLNAKFPENVIKEWGSFIDSVTELVFPSIIKKTFLKKISDGETVTIGRLKIDLHGVKYVRKNWFSSTQTHTIWSNLNYKNRTFTPCNCR